MEVVADDWWREGDQKNIKEMACYASTQDTTPVTREPHDRAITANQTSQAGS